MDFHLDNFDGPLDLLLHLISKNKVSIYDIPIAEILEQYMAVLHEAEHMDLDVAGDFIAMAAQLVYIKSRMLLPKHEEDEDGEDPRAGLVEMLLEYQRLKSATAFFAEKNETGRDIYVKPPERQDDAPVEYHHTVNDLIRAANKMLRRTKRRLPPPVTSFQGIVGREPAPVEVLRVSAHTGEGIDALRERIRGRVSAFAGNSGVGKSSVLNRLDSSFGAEVGAISDKIGRGKHTTRHVELHPIEGGGYIADTPGFSSFETEQMDLVLAEDLQYAFPEFEPYIGQCRFTGCAHVKEKGCAVLAAVENGEIAKTRHESYVKLYESVKDLKEWELTKGGTR